MSISRILESCAAVYAVTLIIEFGRTRRVGRFLAQLAVIVGSILLALLLSAVNTGVVSFGSGASPIAVVAIMFVGTLLGIAARYLFYLKPPFSWLAFLKPLCISPIILLPLIGSLQGTQELQAMQVVSFSFLAFQNGFFWEVVLERSKP